MNKDRWIRNGAAALAAAVVAGSAAAGDEARPRVPQVRDMEGATSLFVRENRREGDAPRIELVIRATGGREQELACPIADPGRFQVAFLAQADKRHAITGFSVVTWKEGAAGEAADERSWPVLEEFAGAVVRIRDAQAVAIRQIPLPEPAGKEEEATAPRAWGFDLVSYRRIEPEGEPEQGVTPARKESAAPRLVEGRRYQLAAPAAPGAEARYGLLLVPVRKAADGALTGFDIRLVRARNPEKKQGE